MTDLIPCTFLGFRFKKKHVLDSKKANFLLFGSRHSVENFLYGQFFYHIPLLHKFSTEWLRGDASVLLDVQYEACNTVPSEAALQ